MDEQEAFSTLLHKTGYGIALYHPVQAIDVGDLCYWDDKGKAVKILNVFDNSQWLEDKKWPRLEMTREQAVVSTSVDAGAHVIHSGGCWWAVSAVLDSPQPCFDICFQRLSDEIAIILPSAPFTVVSLRDPEPLRKWWSFAKRNAFRTWPYLVDSITGIFLVTKAIKSERYARCLSDGSPGQISQIRIYGTAPSSESPGQISLSTKKARWAPVRNDLEFDVQDLSGKGLYTLFIEREACRMFALSDTALRAEATKIWWSLLGPPAVRGLACHSSFGCCSCLPSGAWTGYPTNLYQNAPYVSGISSSAKDFQNYLFASGLTIGSQAGVRGDDDEDRLSLGNGMYLIFGENQFFLELDNAGLDIPINSMTIPHLLLALRKVGSNLAPAAARSISLPSAGIAQTVGSLAPPAISVPPIGQPVFNPGVCGSIPVIPQTSTHLLPNAVQLSNSGGHSIEWIGHGKFNGSNYGVEIPWAWNF